MATTPDVSSVGPRKGGTGGSKMPAGATNMHKNMRVGMGRTEAEDKALTKAQVEPKER